MLKTLYRIVPISLVGLMLAGSANAVYVANDPLNGTDPTGREKQTHARNGHSITLEAGNLPYSEVSSIIDRETGGRYFEKNAGDISDMGKPTSGYQADTLGVVSQLVGSAIENSGNTSLQEARREVTGIVGSDADNGMTGFSNSSGKPGDAGYGQMTLYPKGIASYNGTAGAQTGNTISAWEIHEDRHFENQNQAARAADDGTTFPGPGSIDHQRIYNTQDQITNELMRPQ
jgi:hypothetical protein